ncbi:MAG: hypothetical protein RMJ87_08790 [Cytophagales bacterium]|nr:hypothetical protein [Cytophagales bacterium]
MEHLPLSNPTAAELPLANEPVLVAYVPDPPTTNVDTSPTTCGIIWKIHPTQPESDATPISPSSEQQTAS